ncbi:unnamed protein product [Brachionus calyciflorus]|uniref:Uncharacterized protein n=1 Tax=Brachionus calyciflorus TaxID=104777 RepID=A0A813ZFW3_9BILA|nr:unnamed protein product [Brachionus calyciflorus]
MKFEIILLVALNIALGQCFLFNKANGKWNDLKVTWGINPFNSKNFQSLPRTEAEAVSLGWTKEKNCSQVNGNRYIFNNDNAVLLIFDVRGIIAGIATSIPKGLPFNYPSNKIQPLFNDEGEFYTLSAYFIEPSSVCSGQVARQLTGDRLIIKGNQKELRVPMEQQNLSGFWTQGKCFYTMGLHVWADIEGNQIDENTPEENFSPIFLLYNSGKLNGFGFAFNADLPSKRFEHPDKNVLNMFFRRTPLFYKDANKTGKLSTLHIYLDKTPRLNFC